MPSTPETQNPRISVIVPTFNRRVPLGLALACLAEQTFRDMEVIVVNDAGPDVADVVDGFRDRLDISYIVQPQNSGQSAANNEGLRRARGRHCAVLNDDDLLGPKHFARLIAALDSSPQAVLAYSDCRMVRVRWNSDGTMEKVDWRPYAGGPFERGKLIITNYIPIICALFSREAALASGGFDEGLFHYEDWDLWIRLALHADFVRVPHQSAQYLLHLSGTKNKSRADSYLNNIRSREYIYAKYEQVFVRNSRLAQARQNFWKRLFTEKSEDRDFSDPAGDAQFACLLRLAANAGLHDEAEDLARRWAGSLPSKDSLLALASALAANGKNDEARTCLDRVRNSG